MTPEHESTNIKALCNCTALQEENLKLKEAWDRLSGYSNHDDNCGKYDSYSGDKERSPCTCGYSVLIAETRKMMGFIA